MSTTVDERVVSIQFDNGQFEKNVSTTMNTLDKFKQKLNFSGAYKGLDDIGNAAKRVDFNPLAAGVETVGVKFNALWTIADQTLRNITNSVERTAANVVKSLTITPITTGFNEYELKMGSIQTIMASTGESLDTVNKYLNELNEYSDKTIYSFSDMTSNIGKFTNAGVKLEDAVSAMKGISNEAAVSGANANEASRAMYNFAQALSAGYVKLIDWKSIELANMATVEFKNQLLEAGVAAGTLAKESDGMYKVLTKNANGGEFDGTISATKNFNESLSNQWMTTEVLVSTLRDYADETTEIGKKATKAATEVKTFSQMMDALKESAQSGWAMSWELIFGDFLKGKSLWTSINNVVDGMISKMSDSRNAFLYDSMTSGWDKLIDKINEAEIKTEDFEAAVKRVAKDKGGDVLKIIESYDTLEEAFASGKVSSDILREALDSLDQSGEKLELTIDRLLKRGSNGDDVKQAQTVLKKLGYDLGEFGENLDGIDGKFGSVTKSAIMAFQEANGLVADGILGPKTLEALQKASDGLNETTEESKKLSDSLSDVIDDVEKLGGRALLLKSFSNIFKNIRKIIKTVGKAWDVVFDGNAANKLYSIIEKFHAFTESLNISDENLGKLQNSFEGLFTVIKAVRDVIVKVTSMGLKLAWSLFKPLAEIVVTCTSVMGDFIKTTYSSVSKVFKPINGFLNGFITLIGKFSKFVGSVFVGLVDTIGDSVKKWKESFEETKLFKTVSGYFEDSANVISGALSNISDRIDKVDFGKLTDKFKGVSDFFGKLAKRIGNSEFLVSAVDNVAAGVKAFFGFISNFDFSLPKIDFGSFFDSLFNGFTKLLNFLTINNFKGIGGTIVGTIQYFANLLSIKFTTFKDNALVGISDFFVKFGKGIKKGFEVAIDVFGKIVEFVFGSKKVTLPDILEVVEKFLAIALLWKALNVVGDVTSAVRDVADGFNQLTKSLKWRAVGDAFKAMAVALASLTVCIYVLSKMESKKALTSAGILLGLLAAMAGIVALLTLLSSKLNGEIKMASVALALVGIAGSLAIMVWALKTIDATEFKNLKKSFTIMVGAMLIMATSIGIIGKLCGGTAIKAAAAILTLLTALKLIPAILKQYAEFPWNTVKKGIPAMVTVLLGLATLCRIMTVTSKDAASATGMALLIVSLVLSLKVMLDVIEELGNKDPKKMWQGIKGILAILGGITVMLVAMNLTSKGTVLESGQKSFNSFTGFATALLAVAATIWLFGKMDPKTLLQGGLAMMTTLGMLTAMVAVIGKTSGGAGFKGALPIIIGAGLIIAEMYFIVKSLCGIGWEKALGAAGALSLLLITLTACIEVLSKMGVDVGQVGKGLIMMTALTALVQFGLVPIIKSLKGINGSEAIKQMAALSFMLTSMVACIIILSDLNIDAKAVGNISKSILLMGGLSALLAGLSFVLILLKGIDGQNGIKQAIALSTLLAALTGCVTVLSRLKVDLKEIGEGVLVMLALASAIVALSYVLLVLKNVDGGNAIKQMIALSTMLLSMSACIKILSMIGDMASAAYPAMGALAVFIVGLAALLTALGGIDLLFSGGFSSLLDRAIEIMGKLGEAIGAFIGGIVKGGLEAISSTLPKLGSDLSGFMNNASDFFNGLKNIEAGDVAKAGFLIAIIGGLEGLSALNGIMNLFTIGHSLPNLGKDLGSFMQNADPFFTTIKDLDVSTVKATKVLADTLLTLTAANLIEGLTRFLNFGNDPFSGLEDKLTSLGNGIMSFTKSIAELTPADAEKIKVAAKAGKELTAMASTIPNEGGWAGAILGENDMAVFGKKLEAFGKSLVLYASSISSLTKKDMKNIESSAEAGKALTTMADSIPNEGGWAAAILGENDMAVFGKKLEAFGESLVLYAKSVADLTQSDTDSVIRSADAAKALTDLADSIPNEGGWIAAIVGENDMAEFGRKIAVFGAGLVTYAKTVSNLSDADVEAINGSKSCAEALVEVSKVIPRTDKGLWGLLAGNTDLGSFGSGMSAVANGLKDYSDVAKDIDSSDVEAIRFTKQAIEAMSEAAESIPNAGGLVSLIGGDNNDLTGFASGMTAVAKSVGKCLEEANNISLEDIGSMLALELCIKAMSSAAKSLPNEGGLVSLITGDNSDYIGFANGMSAIAKSVSECIAMISAIPLGDVASILILEQAIKAMTRAAKSLPNEGGLVSLITGDNNDYIGFANGMAAIAKSVRDCIAMISAIPLGDIASIYMLEMAIKAMASAAKSLPNEGGLAGLIFGENSDYLGFSKGMINLAQSVTKCLMEAKNISIGDLASMLALEQAIKAMSRAAESVPTEGSVFEILTGKKMDLSTFGIGMTSLCQSILSCIGYANSFSEESIAKLGTIPMAVKALAAAANAVPTEGSVFEILTGEKMNLTTFGTGVIDLCKSILSCIGYANSFSEDSIVKLGIIPAAVRALAAAVNAVPTEGSVFEILTGEKMDLNTFGTGVIGLCQSILSCIGYANCFSEDNVKQLYTIPAAVRALAAAVNAVPTEGSAFEILTGETMDLNTFGTGVVSLCQSILSCIGYANSFSEESVKQLYIIPAAVRALAAAVNAVPTEGGAFDILTGKTMDLNTFGTGVVDLCKSILSCIGYANCFNEENIEQLGMVKKAVEKLKEVYDILGTEGGVWNEVGETFNGTKDMNFASTMKKMIEDILKCINNAGKMTEENISKLDSVKTAIEKITDVSSNIPESINSVSLKSVSDSIKKLSDSLNSASKVKASSTDGIVSALNKLGDISVDSLASSIKKSSGQVKDAMDTIAKDLVKALDSKKSSFKTSGTDLMDNLVKGLKSKNDAASKAAKGVMSDCVSAIKEKQSSFKSAGKHLGDGLVEGIEAKYQAAYDAGYELGQKAVQGEKDGQASNSPSKLTIKAGKWLGEGLVVGIKKMGEKVYNAGSSMGNNAVDSISNAISRISNTVDADIDSTPTIRPVLDLSAVSAGASEINGMLRMNPSVGVLANVNSINSMMNRNQNGANSDILSAIKDLGKSISNSGGNTYTINGVTYDDGSNVSEAVQSLIRAANIERRI